MKLKGYEFEDELDLKIFVAENCTCAEDLSNQRKIYYVGSNPFLKHEYHNSDLTDLPLSGDKIGINFGTFIFI